MNADIPCPYCGGDNSFRFNPSSGLRWSVKECKRCGLDILIRWNWDLYYSVHEIPQSRPPKAIPIKTDT